MKMQNNDRYSRTGPNYILDEIQRDLEHEQLGDDFFRISGLTEHIENDGMSAAE
jgi:hypothetical protein